MANIKNQNYLFQGPFTQIKAHQKKLFKIRNVRGEFTELFLKQLEEETDLQKKLALEHPKFVMPIKDFKITKGLFQSEQQVQIIYDCDAKCLPIFEAVKDLFGQNVIKRKRELCLKLFKIAQWIFKTKITHRNIKPSNILYYEDKVLLTDFGSQRTFYQNYLADFTSEGQKEWQQQYYFYATKEYLEILKTQADLDFRRDELKDWSSYQQIDQQINSDLWAIGLIILEIFCSKDDISKEIGCDITSNIKQYYGLNRKNLNKALDIFKKLTDTDLDLYEALKNLLDFNYPIVWEKISNDDQKQPIGIEAVQIEQSKPLPSNQPSHQPPQPEIFTSIRNFNQLNFSIIKFSQVFPEPVIPQLGLTQQELKQETEETIKKTKLFIFDVVNEITKNLEIQIYSEKFKTHQSLIQMNKQELEQQQEQKKKSNENQNKKDNILNIIDLKFISHQSLIHMNKQELEQYQEQIKQSNEIQIQKDNTQDVIDFRLKALALLDSNKNDFQEDLIFYLNDQEYDKLLQNRFYSVNLSQEKQQFKNELIEKTKKLICKGYNYFNFNDYQYLNIKVLQFNSDDQFVKDILKNKIQSLETNGIEDLKFNQPLKLVNKCERFIRNGESKDLIKDYKEFEKIGHLKQDYKKKLLQQIKNQQFSQEIREQYEQAIFEIYEKLDWELDCNKNRRLYHEFDDFMKKYQINDKVNTFILYIYNQKIQQPQNTFSRSDEIYLRKLEFSKDLRLKQNIQNNTYNSQYYGQVIDGIPYGFGYTILEKNFIQFGIYQNNKLIQGWSIKFKWNFLSTDQIYFNQGKFENSFLKNGKAEEIFITQVSHGIDYTTYKLKVGSFLNNKLEGEGMYKIENFEKIIYEEREGTFKQDNLHGQGKIFYDTQYQNYREGQFENGKQIGVHYEYKMINGKQVKNPIKSPHQKGKAQC